jgi:hypothetical protein
MCAFIHRLLKRYLSIERAHAVVVDTSPKLYISQARETRLKSSKYVFEGGLASVGLLLRMRLLRRVSYTTYHIQVEGG